MSTIDPVTAEVVSAGLRAIAAEMKVAVMRTAYSPIVSSGGDMSVGIADVEGRVVAQGRDIPAQLGALPASLRAMLKGRHGQLGPGDVLIGNDVYESGSNHVNDVCLVMPAYDVGEERLLGYVVTRTHWMDIGGGTPGSFNVRVPDMYAEGLRIPPLLAYRHYEPETSLWTLIFANVRGRTEREWDLRAGYAGCLAGQEGLRRLAARYAPETLAGAMDHARAYTERRVRTRIEAMPDGTYTAVDWLEGDGFEDRPVRLEVALSVRGSDVHFDWTGTDPQVRGGLNIGMPSTAGVCVYALKAALDPEVPPNHGMWAPVTVAAPEGSLVNPRPPAPTQASLAETIQRMADLLMLCLSQVAPEQVMAGTCATAGVIMFEALDPVAWRRRGLGRDRVIVMDNVPGGMGGRATIDGVSGVKVHTGNARVVPAEILEFNAPLRVTRWERVVDTGGPGRCRGGTGVVREWELLDDLNATICSERVRVPAFGLAGGRAGAVARFLVDPGTEAEVALPSKTPPMALRAGQRVVMQAAGGGGYGPPRERDAQTVANDVLDGYVSRAAAERDYGVVVDEHGRLDAPATARRRSQPVEPVSPTSFDRGTVGYDVVVEPQDAATPKGQI